MNKLSEANEKAHQQRGEEIGVAVPTPGANGAAVQAEVASLGNVITDAMREAASSVKRQQERQAPTGEHRMTANSQAVRGACQTARDMCSQIDETIACLAVQQMFFETSGEKESAQFIKLTSKTLENVQSYLTSLSTGFQKLEKALSATQEVVESKQNIIDVMDRRLAYLAHTERV